MGADLVVVYYGIKKVVEDSAEVLHLEEDEHPWQVLADGDSLRVWWGNCVTPTNPEAYYVLLGAELGRFGGEALHSLTIADADLLRTMSETRESLTKAGLQDEPAIQVQLDVDD